MNFQTSYIFCSCWCFSCFQFRFAIHVIYIGIFSSHFAFKTTLWQQTCKKKHFHYILECHHRIEIHWMFFFQQAHHLWYFATSPCNGKKRLGRTVRPQLWGPCGSDRWCAYHQKSRVAWGNIPPKIANAKYPMKIVSFDSGLQRVATLGWSANSQVRPSMLTHFWKSMMDSILARRRFGFGILSFLNRNCIWNVGRRRVSTNRHWILKHLWLSMQGNLICSWFLFM